jgi:hypothetical protein
MSLRSPFTRLNLDTAPARSSRRRLANPESTAVSPGHGDPALQDVPGQLIDAAEDQAP